MAIYTIDVEGELISVLAKNHREAVEIFRIMFSNVLASDVKRMTSEQIADINAQRLLKSLGIDE